MNSQEKQDIKITEDQWKAIRRTPRYWIYFTALLVVIFFLVGIVFEAAEVQSSGDSKLLCLVISWLVARRAAKTVCKRKIRRGEMKIPTVLLLLFCIPLFSTSVYGQSAGDHNRKGIVLHEKGDLDGAIAEYREAIRLAPNYSQAFNNLCGALKDKHQLNDAAAACRESIRLKPSSASAHNNLGIVLMIKNLLDEAIAEYRKAIELDGNEAKFYFNLGLALELNDDPDGAAAEYEEAIKLDPDHANAHNNLGRIVEELYNIPSEALEHYSKACKLQPKNKEFCDNYNRLRKKLNK